MTTFSIKLLNRSNYSWLKKSGFYRSLNENENEDDESDVDDNMFGIICPENTDDINLFLEVGKFWTVDEYPDKFYTLLNKNKSLELLNLLKEIYEETKDPFYLLLKSSLELEPNRLNQYMAQWVKMRLLN